MLKKRIFRFWPFLDFFLPKIVKIYKKLIKFGKSNPYGGFFLDLICRCFPTKENAAEKWFFDFSLFLPFFGQKTAKTDQKWRKLPKSKLFDKIFWNLVCRCFPTKENPEKKLFFDFSFFWPFLDKKTAKKTAKIGPKWRNWQKSNRLMKFSEI